MAKQMKTVSIKDTNTGRESVLKTTAMPRKKEVGVIAKLGINQYGLEWLQKEKGIPMKDVNEAIRQIWLQVTGMPEEGVGSLGKWNTEEERAAFQVTVANENGENAYDWDEATKGYSRATAKAEKQEKEEPVKIDPSVFGIQVTQRPMEAEVVADKNPVEKEDLDEKTVKKVAEFLSKEKPVDEIKKGLMNKFKDEAVVEQYFAKGQELFQKE